MGIFGRFRRGAATRYLVGRIADEPQFVGANGKRYMVFRLEEAPEKEFRLSILPTTPKRHKGDRVEISWSSEDGGVALVEALAAAAPDAETIRRRNEAYLKDVQSQ